MSIGWIGWTADRSLSLHCVSPVDEVQLDLNIWQKIEVLVVFIFPTVALAKTR